MRKYLTHPNIVPFLGVTSTPSQLISDRMPGGDLLGYIEMYPNGDRLGIVSAPPGAPIPVHLPQLLAIRCG